MNFNCLSLKIDMPSRQERDEFELPFSTVKCQSLLCIAYSRNFKPQICNLGNPPISEDWYNYSAGNLTVGPGIMGRDLSRGKIGT